MRSSYMFETLRSGKSYDSKTQSEITAHGDENTGDAETGIIEGSNKNSVGFYTELLDERIKVSLERLHAQISALSEMMDRLILSNLAKKATTASYRRNTHQNESPYNERSVSSRFPTVAPLTTAGYSPNINLLN